MSQMGNVKLWYVRAGKSLSRYGYGSDIHSKQEMMWRIVFLFSRQLTTGGIDNDMEDFESKSITLYFWWNLPTERNMRVCKIYRFVHE